MHCEGSLAWTGGLLRRGSLAGTKPRDAAYFHREVFNIPAGFSSEHRADKTRTPFSYSGRCLEECMSQTGEADALIGDADTHRSAPDKASGPRQGITVTSGFDS